MAGDNGKPPTGAAATASARGFGSFVSGSGDEADLIKAAPFPQRFSPAKLATRRLMARYGMGEALAGAVIYLAGIGGRT